MYSIRALVVIAVTIIGLPLVGPTSWALAYPEEGGGALDCQPNEHGDTGEVII